MIANRKGELPCVATTDLSQCLIRKSTSQNLQSAPVKAAWQKKPEEMPGKTGSRKRQQKWTKGTIKLAAASSRKPERSRQQKAEGGSGKQQYVCQAGRKKAIKKAAEI